MAMPPPLTCWELEICGRSAGTTGSLFRSVRRTMRCAPCVVWLEFPLFLCWHATIRCQGDVQNCLPKGSGNGTVAAVNIQEGNLVRTKGISITLCRGRAEASHLGRTAFLRISELTV